MLVIPALGRLRQDDRTFVPVGLIPSKYHKKKKRRQKTQCLAGRQRNSLGMMTVKEVPPTGLLTRAATAKVPTGWTQGCCLETCQAPPKSSAASWRFSTVSGHTILTIHVCLWQRQRGHVHLQINSFQLYQEIKGTESQTLLNFRYAHHPHPQ